ncbi:MAG: acyl-CoA desaturase [Bacteroidetes bacterium]|nr:acyl-CoA desaturase [Bacteroidota bacterium]
MRWKTVAMIAIYLVPFGIILSGYGAVNLAIYLLLWVLMGLGMVGIGTSVMHDSNHGAYSKNKTVNKMLGAIIVLVGGYHVTWRIQHNILHHTYTNIEGLDGDIDAGVLLRFSPHSKHYKMHRFQHLYAWFLYGLLTVQWATIKDYLAVIDYNKKDLLKKEKRSLARAIWEITGWKILYYSIFLVLPILFSGVAWGWVVLGFFLMHFFAGLALSCIFQLAHVMEDAEFPQPLDNNKMQNNWAVHQVLNTINFSPRSKIMSWFIGGLNYQIEHHLFPHICHVHYPELSKIVKRTATKWGIPYQEEKTFLSALIEHGKMLKKLGKKENWLPQTA